MGNDEMVGGDAGPQGVKLIDREVGRDEEVGLVRIA